MRFALEDRRTVEMMPDSFGDPLAYFFHLRGKSIVQKSLKGMLKELLYQLLRQFPGFYAQIDPIYKRSVRMLMHHEWDLESLAEGFLQIPKLTSCSEKLRNRVFLFIDALDENENQKDNETMMKLIKRLSSEYESTAKNPKSPLLKICLASRSWPFFEREMGGNARIPSLAIHNFTTDDIRIYASALLEEPLQSLDLPAAYQSGSQQLVNEIIERANGVFVWVRVVVDSMRRHITDGTSIEVLRKKILEYPKELKDLYEFTVKRIPGDYWKELEVALKVLFSSQTALTLTELYVLTQICIDQRPPQDFQASQQTSAWLASRSGGLIEEINVSPTVEDVLDQQQVGKISSVQFVHQTVQDFVITGIKGLPEPRDHGPRLLVPPGHHLIASACLDSPSPHPCMSRVAQKLFSYFRECERDWDTNAVVPDGYGLRRWDANELIRAMTDRLLEFAAYHLSDVRLNHPPRMFMDEANVASTIKIITELSGRFFASDDVSNILNTRPAPQRVIQPSILLDKYDPLFLYAILLISQNLYYPEFLPYTGQKCTNVDHLVTLAAVGQRSTEYRTDRLRMLKKILEVSDIMSAAASSLQVLRKPSLAILGVKPAPEVNWDIPNSTLATVTTALPCGEITEAMLRDMAKLLLENRSTAFGDINEMICMRFAHRPELSLFEYCAMYKGQQGHAWLQLISRYKPRIRDRKLFERALFLRMGLYDDEEEPDMRQGIVFPGLAAAVSRGLGLRYIFQSFSDTWQS